MGQKRIFSPDELSEAEALLEQGASYAALGRKYNCCPDTIFKALYDKVFGPVLIESLHLRLGRGARATTDMLLKRDERLSVPHRDLTGLLQGDPRVGQSALDRKLAGVPA